MALHRKQRGSADALPQYVRLPAARAAPSPVASASTSTRHPRKPRARLLRDVYPAPRQQIGSLQLRACFLLCVVLYFGTIYFADNIVSLGQALGSEPARSSHDFFVQSGEPVKDEAATHLRVAAAATGDDAGGGEEDAAVKEVVMDEEVTGEREDAPPVSPNDAESPREDPEDPEVPIEKQGDAEDEKKADDPPLIPAKAAEREHKTDNRPVVRFPALMRPQTAGADVATGRQDALPTPEQRRIPSETVEAVAPADALKNIADQAMAANPAELDGHQEEAAAAAVKTEGKDGVAAGMLRRGAPPDEADEEANPPTQEEDEEDEAADPSPHEEHQ
jgi:hypothetical protein